MFSQGSAITVSRMDQPISRSSRGSADRWTRRRRALRDSDRPVPPAERSVSHVYYETAGYRRHSGRVYGRILGANDRVGVGFVGYGLIGSSARIRLQEPERRRHGRHERHLPTADGARHSCVRQRRQRLSRFSEAARRQRYSGSGCLDAGPLARLMAMMACAAGKDVYVEKPLSMFVKEGRWSGCARKSTGDGSGRHTTAYRQALPKGREMIRTGHIGKVVQQDGRISKRDARFRRSGARFGRTRRLRLRHVARARAQAPV